MAVWYCTKCGNEREAKCKPRKCPNCGESGTYEKKE